MHYVCTGNCGCTSETPCVCETEGCVKEGKPMIECGCTDSQHKEAIDKTNKGE
ncbi:MAG: hypothetical protein HYT43_00120 [Candidatus Taylorbacteria bacterium]|nr:hypothetical protein [Candidatus Taylorbacteria bacterium]